MYQTSSYIDALGKRLRAGRATEKDLEELASFHRSFRFAYDHIFAETMTAGYEPTGRYPKTTPAIIAKLKRSSTRLSRMQDIAGVRIVVSGPLDQDRAVEELTQLALCRVQDRRATPSYGYRAVHIIYDVDSVPVEAQVRTKLQHAWAELSEKLADRFGPDVKYGGGPADFQNLLKSMSRSISIVEDLAKMHPGGFPQQAELEGQMHAIFEDIGAKVAKASRGGGSQTI